MRLKILCCLLIIVGKLQAEPTPSGGTPTLVTSDGQRITLYYPNGNPVPPGENIKYLSGSWSIWDNDSQFRFVELYDSQKSIKDNQTKILEYEKVFGPIGGSVSEFAAGNAPKFYPLSKDAKKYYQGSKENIANANESTSGVHSKFVDKLVHDKSNLKKKEEEFFAHLHNAAKLGKNSCRATDTSMPKSLSEWWLVAKDFLANEKSRLDLVNAKVDEINSKLVALKKDSASKELQIESINIQIELVNTSIESLEGKNGLIPLHDKLSASLTKSAEANKKENATTYLAYKKMVDQDVALALNIADEACNRIEKETICSELDSGPANCRDTENTKPIPVKGCEQAKEMITLFKTSPAQKYGDTYLQNKPSINLNASMEKYEQEMQNILSDMPKSDDSGFDWHKPLEESLRAMIAARKASGTKCELNVSSIIEDDKEDNNVPKPLRKKLWPESDKLIGQAGLRADYFESLKKSSVELNENYKKQLDDLKKTKLKLLDYLEKLKVMIGNK